MDGFLSSPLQLPCKQGHNIDMCQRVALAVPDFETCLIRVGLQMTRKICGFVRIPAKQPPAKALIADQHGRGAVA